MRLNVEIYQDENFVRKVKNLMLSKMNEILKDDVDLKELITELLIKYIQRDLIKKYIDDSIEYHLKTEYVKVNTWRSKIPVSEYIKEKIDEYIQKSIAEMLKDYNIIIKKTK